MRLEEDIGLVKIFGRNKAIWNSWSMVEEYCNAWVAQQLKDSYDLMHREDLLPLEYKRLFLSHVHALTMQKGRGICTATY